MRTDDHYKGIPVRDDRFKAVHRGGSLDLERHRQLAIWAADCAEHVLALFETICPLDDRPRHAIETARAWAAGEVSVGAARTAAFAAHAAAGAATDVAAREAARAAGHAVATAHMADHSLGPAWYGVRAVRASAGVAAAERERAWQLNQLLPSIRELVVSALATPRFAG
jgi:hypothetical protein